MRASSIRARARLAATLALAATGCTRACGDAQTTIDAGGPSSSVSAPAASAVPEFTGDAGKLANGDWARAAAGDPADLDRLARREGAVGLMVAVRGGGTRGRVALSALPRAPDAELVLSELCALAHEVGPEDTGRVLRAVHGIAARPPPPRERFSAEGVTACPRLLDALAKRPDLKPTDRDLAISARRMLGEHEPSQKQ